MKLTNEDANNLAIKFLFKIIFPASKYSYEYNKAKDILVKRFLKFNTDKSVEGENIKVVVENIMNHLVKNYNDGIEVLKKNNVNIYKSENLLHLLENLNEDLYDQTNTYFQKYGKGIFQGVKWIYNKQVEEMYIRSYQEYLIERGLFNNSQRNIGSLLKNLISSTKVIKDLNDLLSDPQEFASWIENNKTIFNKAFKMLSPALMNKMRVEGVVLTDNYLTEGFVDNIVKSSKSLIMMVIIILNMFVYNGKAFAGEDAKTIADKAYEDLKNKYKKYSASVKDDIKKEVKKLDVKKDEIVKDVSKNVENKSKEVADDVKKKIKNIDVDELKDKAKNKSKDMKNDIVNKWNKYKETQKAKIDSIPVKPAPKQKPKQMEI